MPWLKETATLCHVTFRNMHFFIWWGINFIGRMSACLCVAKKGERREGDDRWKGGNLGESNEDWSLFFFFFLIPLRFSLGISSHKCGWGGTLVQRLCTYACKGTWLVGWSGDAGSGHEHHDGTEKEREVAVTVQSGGRPKILSNTVLFQIKINYYCTVQCKTKKNPHRTAICKVCL